MGTINIYKIDGNKYQAFYEAISEKLNQVQSKDIIKNYNNEEIVFGMTLFIAPPLDAKEVSWNWVLAEFEQPPITNLPNNKSILLIEGEENFYAITFGSSHFIVDKFCDRNFAFSFARKIRYKAIRTTALTTPNSQRNKTINTYVDYNNLEFDSGESFTKIKARALIDDNFRIHNEAIEIGNSIKFSLPNDSLDSIANLILYIEDVIENCEDRYKIPVFGKVSDDILTQTLNDNLLAVIRNNPCNINISEFDIVGATEVFNHNDTTFKLIFRSYEKTVPELNYPELQQFANQNNFSLNEHLLDIKVISYNEGNSVRTDSLKNLIDYTDEEERCILSKGQWYQYNDDYLNYLSESLAEIDVIHNPDYNFSKAQRKMFLDRKYLEERHKVEYTGKSEEEVKKSISNKYYAERYFNIMLTENFGFKNLDRNGTRIGTAVIELMDLYKDNTMFAVKIGKSSEKLCYVVDQSIQAMKAYKHNLTEDKPIISNVGIWIVLERNPLTLENGSPNINKLDMLILKNKIDYWKKEVRILGYKPLIYINYVID